MKHCLPARLRGSAWRNRVVLVTKQCGSWTVTRGGITDVGDAQEGWPDPGRGSRGHGVSQQRVSAIESGAVAELATLGDYIRALGGELKVIADFGDSWRRVA